MGRRRSGDVLHARAVDGIFEGIPREQKLARKISTHPTLSQLAQIAAEHLSEYEPLELCEARDLEPLIS